MKTVVFFLMTLQIVSAFFNSKSYKIHEFWEGSLNIPYRRIQGGMPADENQFPFMVVLLQFTFHHTVLKCSGSLLKTDLVLTAAHCTQNFFPDMAIVVGGQADCSMYFKKRLRYPARAIFDSSKYNIEERWPSEFITHPGYINEGDRFHDIALVRLQEPFTSPNITTIPLSTEKMKNPMICTILGWGLIEKDTSTNILHYANAIAKPSDMGCEYLTEGPVLCLERGNTATCFGDSGSPLVCNGKVWGVAAFIRFKGKERCDKGVEDYYTEIYPELEWLNNPTCGGSSVVATSKNTFFFTDFCLLFLFEKFVVYL